MNESTLMLLRIPAILISLTIHEYAHGYVAWLRGDNTARDAGRLTLNPVAHLDIFGTLMLLFGPFGWAKPVPVNDMNLDNPKRDILWVSAAGPLSNIALAVVVGYAYRFILTTQVGKFMPVYAHLFIQLLIMINLGLSFFNLLPIPPLDGSKILMSFLPPQKVISYLRMVHYAPKVFLVLLAGEWLLHIPIFSAIINPIWSPYYSFWKFIIFGGSAY